MSANIIPKCLRFVKSDGTSDVNYSVSGLSAKEGFTGIKWLAVKSSTNGIVYFPLIDSEKNGATTTMLKVRIDNTTYFVGSVRQRLHVYWGFTKNSDTDRYFAVYWPSLLWSNWLYTEDITITVSLRRTVIFGTITTFETTIRAGQTFADPDIFVYPWTTNDPANYLSITVSGNKLGTVVVLYKVLNDTSVSFAWHDYNING